MFHNHKLYIIIHNVYCIIHVASSDFFFLEDFNLKKLKLEIPNRKKENKALLPVIIIKL